MVYDTHRDKQAVSIRMSFNTHSEVPSSYRVFIWQDTRQCVLQDILIEVASLSLHLLWKNSCNNLLMNYFEFYLLFTIYIKELKKNKINLNRNTYSRKPHKKKPAINNRFIIDPWPNHAKAAASKAKVKVAKAIKSIFRAHFCTLQWRITIL